MRTASRIVGGFLCAAASVLLSVPANAKASAAAGEALARQWCATCHVVAADQSRGNPDVPTFFTIADSDLTEAQIATFLSGNHPVMPDMALSRAEIAALVAYIRSLKSE